MSYAHYCQLYWLYEKQRITTYVSYDHGQHHRTIRTTLPITSCYAFFHPCSPRPTRFTQFVFSYQPYLYQKT